MNQLPAPLVAPHPVASPAGGVRPAPVAWIVGGLGAGRDGVGDHVARIAAELRARHDLESYLVALRDPDVATVESTRTSLRLPGGLPPVRAAATAERFLAATGAATLCWHVVPPALARRGVFTRVEAQAHARLGRHARVHVYLHELWCGTGRRETWRDRLQGLLQRPALLRWLEQVGPEAILTSNPAYAAVLQAEGLSVRVVPLCGNIPPAPDPGRTHWPDALRPAPLVAEPRGGGVLAGVFGAIHHNWRPEPALRQLASHARAAGRRLVLVWFGRGSAAGERVWTRLGAALRDTALVLRLGAVPAPALSSLLAACDLGLPTIPFNLLGKSGTAAAFREHGVPVLVTSDHWWPRQGKLDRPAAAPGIHLWSPASPADFGRILADRPPRGTGLDACLAGWSSVLGLASRP